MKQTWQLVISSIVLVWGMTGCVTPPEVKDMSTKHSNNLIALENSVQAYQSSIADYYDRVILLQRQAYISQKVRGNVHEIASSQADSLRQLPEGASQDFIDAGAQISEAFPFWGKNFDLWVQKAEGSSLEEKKKWFEKKAQETQGAASIIYLKQAQRSDDDLTYISVAIDLEQQKKVIVEQVNLLGLQVKSMQQFHAIVDNYLSIDATIDAQKIAEAAAAGSRADVSGLVGP